MNNKIKLQGLLRDMVNEEIVNGVKATEKAQKESKKFNDEYNKDVSKKMKDYEEPVMPKEDKDISDMNRPGNPEDDAAIENTDVRNDMSLLNIEGEPNKTWEDRQDMALKGDKMMGNETKTGKWNPETGEGNGNTEEVWGASGGKVIGDTIAKNVKDIRAMRKKEKIGKEVDGYRLYENKTKKENTMKRLRFKNKFDGLGNALNLIPENYKVNDKEFEMTDGVESYTMRWEGNLNEGAAVVLKAADQNMINEDMEKMKHLMGFNSNENLGRLKGHERINENESFNDVWKLTTELMKESDDVNENATSVGGFGFVAEDLTAEEEVVAEEEVNEEEVVAEEDVNEEEVVAEEEVNEEDKVSAKVPHAKAEGPMVMAEEDEGETEEK